MKVGISKALFTLHSPSFYRFPFQIARFQRRSFYTGNQKKKENEGAAAEPRDLGLSAVETSLCERTCDESETCVQQSQHAAGKQRAACWQVLDLAPCDVLNVKKVPSSGHAGPASRLVRKSAGRPRNKSVSEGNSVPLNRPRSNSYPSPA